MAIRHTFRSIGGKLKTSAPTSTQWRIAAAKQRTLRFAWEGDAHSGRGPGASPKE